MKKFNIAALAVAATGIMHVKDFDNQPLFADDKGEQPVRIHLHGPGSHAYSVVEGRQTARAVKRMNDNEGKIAAISPEERRLEAAEDLATLTASFENFDLGNDLQGEALFHAVYADPKLGHVTKQVTKFLAEWGNFKPASLAA